MSNNDLSNYLVDLYQRNILFMDTMRRRGNDMVTMTTQPSANVLNFEIEKILEGKDFNQPINYWLARVLPPQNIPTDSSKRPYVMQDPRAGRGPGISGFKKESEIGAALQYGHPVYFIGFDADPIENQTYSDVIRGQVLFYQKVSELHPNSPKLCAIGNCAGGYMTMFAAMQAPKLFGPVLIAGSPISYWNGTLNSGKPMRYIASEIGGAWLTALIGDIGGGRFDGTNLVMNFNNIDFDNFIWGKQYDLYKNIDTSSERFLSFERWLSSFGDFNREEILWLVRNLFINNQLTTGQLTTDDGISLDPRLIDSPIITFVSDGDTISPPAQSAGWIADLYHDVDEIIARNKTIVYCLNHKVGHLALFTGSKVAKCENQLFVQNMDSIELLPPGLYELILDVPDGLDSCNSKQLEARYVSRTIEDIKKLGYNSEDDNRAFATLAKASEAWLSNYNNFIHPFFTMYHQNYIAKMTKYLQPLRWNYWVFAEQYNPLMKIFSQLSSKVKQNRKIVTNDNPYLSLQTQLADNTTKFLSNLKKIRDNHKEQNFFMIWGNTQVQKFWDTYNKPARLTPSQTKTDLAEIMALWQSKINNITPVNDELSALIRIMMLIINLHNES